jgi:hypothetical protein
LDGITLIVGKSAVILRVLPMVAAFNVVSMAGKGNADSAGVLKRKNE